jgi:hypothetical protein
MALARVQYEQQIAANKAFTVTMPYISKDHIQVSVDGVDLAFTWLNENTVNITVAPAIGSVVDIMRVTEREVLLVDFRDASTITEKQLDLSARQTFFIAQEAFDATGGTMAVADDGSYSANNRRISLVGDPDSDDDVPNVRWVKDQYNSGRDANVERLAAEVARVAAQAAATTSTTNAAAALASRNTADAHRIAAAAASSAATVSQTAAKASEDKAKLSETAAKAVETVVGNSATAAALSEANALSYRNTANAANVAASGHAVSANASMGKASLWAEAAVDAAVEAGKFSAKHHASKAIVSSSTAATSASEAVAYRDTALTHRNAASTSAAEALASKNAAATSASTVTTEANRAQTEANRAQSYAAAIDIPSAAGQAGRILRQKTDETGFEFSDHFVPSGGIIMWAGLISAIPIGWRLCDGTNGSPNLRDRFVVGAGTTYAVGAIGGSADAVVVDHNHGASTSSAGDHSHSGTTATAGNHTHQASAGSTTAVRATNAVRFFFEGQTWSAGAEGYSPDLAIKAAGDHTHTFATTSAGGHIHTVTVTNTGVSGVGKNLPPFYALAFIQKL